MRSCGGPSRPRSPMPSCLDSQVPCLSLQSPHSPDLAEMSSPKGTFGWSHVGGGVTGWWWSWSGWRSGSGPLGTFLKR